MEARERESARARFPLDSDLLRDLFAHVEHAVDEAGCDHTLRWTEQWIVERSVDRDPLVEWLPENGGYCDCEVVANAADHWEQNS